MSDVDLQAFEGPATLIFSRKVKPGREAAYRAWVSGFQDVALPPVDGTLARKRAALAHLDLARLPDLVTRTLAAGTSRSSPAESRRLSLRNPSSGATAY